MLVPSSIGLYLLPPITYAGLIPLTINSTSTSYVALLAACDLALWHRRLGQLNMHSLHAQHLAGALFVPAMPSFVLILSFAINLTLET
jgi:hypothetical protein